MAYESQGRHRVAAVQMASGSRVDSNRAEVARLITMAVEQGAGLVVLPENVAFMGMQETDKLALRETDAGGPLQRFFAEQAARHGVWLVAGTIPMIAQHPERARQSTLVYNPQGQRVARYDKIHLFDAVVDGDGAYKESATLEAGDTPVVVETPFGRMGLAVCYDLRFPEFFRLLADRGADFVALPSAFTARTGEAHWRPLVQARAIENACYMVAADQGGYHVNGRETHGDSLVVDPWGRVLDSLARGSGVVIGELDPGVIRDVRQRLPALNHRRYRVVPIIEDAPAEDLAADAPSAEH